jgi:integrase
VADYLEHLEGRASWADAKRRLQAFALPAFGDKSVNDLDEDEIRKWHRAIAKQGARARTKPGAPQNYRKSEGDPEAYRKRQASANRCLDLLKAVLNLARRNHKRTGVKSSEAWDCVERFKGVHIPRSRYLTIAECKRLMNACDPEFRILVRAALETGARYQELARLRVVDFNPDSGTLHVRKSKAHKDRHIVLTDDGRELFCKPRCWSQRLRARDRFGFVFSSQGRGSRGIRPITPISLEEISGAIMMWRGHDPKNGRP